MQEPKIAGRSIRRAAGLLVLTAAMVCGGASGTRAWAQATTATLVGTVTDTTGAALGHATVAITNQKYRADVYRPDE